MWNSVVSIHSFKIQFQKKKKKTCLYYSLKLLRIYYITFISYSHQAIWNTQYEETRFNGLFWREKNNFFVEKRFLHVTINFYLPLLLPLIGTFACFMEGFSLAKDEVN